MSSITQDDVTYLVTAVKDGTFSCKEHTMIIRDDYKEAKFLYDSFLNKGYRVIILDLMFRNGKKPPVTIMKHRNTSANAAKNTEPDFSSFEKTD